jgi:hypothetical protein
MNLEPNSNVSAELLQIRVLRTVAHAPLAALILVALTSTALRFFLPEVGEALWSSAPFRILWPMLWVGGFIAFFVGFAVRSLKCPGCGKPFHVRSDGNSWVYNEFCRSCLNCGLRLNGSGSNAP